MLPNDIHTRLGDGRRERAVEWFERRMDDDHGP